jgi:hypothetical protein
MVTGNSAANKAGKLQAQGTIDAAKIIDDQYQQSRTDQMPWMTNGQSANNQLAMLLGVGGDKNATGYGSLAQSFSAKDLYDDPSYNFRLQEGEKALNRSTAARGGLLSGAAMKASQRYGQDYASTEYGAAFDRYNQNQTNLFNKLAGLSNAGQSSAQNLAGLGANAANQRAELKTDQANYMAGIKSKQNQVFNEGVAGIEKSVQDAAMAYLTGGMSAAVPQGGGGTMGQGGYFTGQAPMTGLESQQRGIKWQ